jgi:tetratricopeptide (TPR) repeat protein
MSVAVAPGGPEFNRVLAMQMRRMVEHLINGSSTGQSAADPLRQSQMALNFLGKAQQLGDMETLVQLLEHFGGLLRGSSHAAVLDQFFELALAGSDLSNAQRVKLASLHALLFIIRGELGRAEAVLTAAWGAADSSLLQAELYNRLGVLLEVQGNFTESMQAYERALAIAYSDMNLKLMTRVYNHMGNWAYAQDDYALALVRYEKALSIAEKLGATDDCAEAEGGMAMTLTELGRYEEANLYHQRARVHYEQNGNLGGVVRTVLNSSYLYLQQGNYQDAKRLAGHALQQVRQLGDMDREANALHNLGRACLLQGDYESAYIYLREALEKRRWMGMPIFIEETETAIRELIEVLERNEEISSTIRTQLLAACESMLEGTQS